MTNNDQLVYTQFQENVQKNSGLVIFLGALLMLMGIIAMGSPLAAGISLALLVGYLLIISGIGQMIFAFSTSRGVLTFILGLLTIAIGGYMVSHPAAALTSLTLFLTAYLVVSGIFEVIFSLKIRPVSGWGLAAVTGVLSIVLGVMIWNQLPFSGAWAVGFLIGARLLMNGVTFLALGIAARK